jgi:hypothetical protein
MIASMLRSTRKVDGFADVGPRCRPKSRITFDGRGTKTSTWDYNNRSNINASTPFSYLEVSIEKCIVKVAVLQPRPFKQAERKFFGGWHEENWMVLLEKRKRRKIAPWSFMAFYLKQVNLLLL